eukprot:CAMPEP_0115862346 /NCGR_PEP_ID=MMETSP0287-20121206/18126_1 /TAXON_ID=412157 /ORGANISM="Chrysochromulina rotalis, Strain UIO044" /LENGTH=176 /DNA_ID=CAMNT_0003316759 /DNA_START=141 /DNA_END=671 /DNA_ORIENTATION=+
MIPGLNRALPEQPGQPKKFTYLIEGQFDSNPCRSTCMLNPIYDLLPRMEWITASHICQRIEDFTYDPVSESMCCPAPNYCCPNSVSSCNDPGAIRFDAVKAGVTAATIVEHWPLSQSRPFSWELTQPSRELVRSAWMQAAESRTPITKEGQTVNRVKWIRAAKEVMTSTTFRRKGE